MPPRVRAFLVWKKNSSAVAIASATYRGRSSARTRAAVRRWRRGASRTSCTEWWGWTRSRELDVERGSCTWCRSTAPGSTRTGRRSASPVFLRPSTHKDASLFCPVTGLDTNVHGRIQDSENGRGRIRGRWTAGAGSANPSQLFRRWNNVSTYFVNTHQLPTYVLGY